MYVIHPNYILHEGGGGWGMVGISPCSKIVPTQKCGGAVTQGHIQGCGGVVIMAGMTW